MKIFHTGDLHIGKVLNGFSMLDDQEYILNIICKYIVSEKPDVLIIAGDVYDKRIPPIEAVDLFSQFITKAAGIVPAIMIIPGNHDSSERLSFASRLMERQGVFIARNPMKVTRSDEYGDVDFFLLPFTKPALVRHLFPDKEINNSADAVVFTLDALGVGIEKRSVFAAHQPFTAMGQELLGCESDTLYIGGADTVDTVVLAKYSFDYAAFGHLHGPQTAGSPRIRYSGSPLKYSFSECLHKKSLVMIDLSGKGQAETTILPLNPKRDLRKVKGTISRLLSPAIVAEANPEDYLHVTLTDEEEVYGAIEKIRNVYPNYMQIVYDNSRTRADDSEPEAAKADEKTPLELFQTFFEQRNGAGMTEEQERVVRGLLEAKL